MPLLVVAKKKRKVSLCLRNIMIFESVCLFRHPCWPRLCRGFRATCTHTHMCVCLILSWDLFFTNWAVSFPLLFLFPFFCECESSRNKREDKFIDLIQTHIYTQVYMYVCVCVCCVDLRLRLFHSFVTLLRAPCVFFFFFQVFGVLRSGPNGGWWRNSTWSGNKESNEGVKNKDGRVLAEGGQPCLTSFMHNVILFFWFDLLFFSLLLVGRRAERRNQRAEAFNYSGKAHEGKEQKKRRTL